jgi:hypothetical protein
MGNSIIGEKWHNATSSDIANIDQLISAKTAQLNQATTLLSEALTAIQLCNNSSWGCVSKSGRHISTWRDQRDANAPLVERYKNELLDLTTRRDQLVRQMGDVAVATQVTAVAEKAIAEAESVQTASTAKKVLLYGGIGLIVIIGGIIAYKLIKRK